MNELLAKIDELLPAYSYLLGNEIQLHEGIAKVLDEAGIEYQREYIAGPRDRFDFLVTPGIVIEAKIKGSLSQALEQVKRYAQREDVNAVILVTTRFWGNTRFDDDTVFGKPVKMLKLQRRSF